MSPPRSRRVCHVCRRPGSPREPIADTVLRDEETGKAWPYSVHNGPCLEALLAEGRFTLYARPGTTEQPTAHPSDPPSQTGGSPVMSKSAAPPTDSTTPAAEEATQELRPDPGAEVAVPDRNRAAIPGLTTDRVVAHIARGEPLPDLQGQDAGMEIARRLLTADTEAELLEEQVFTHAKDLLFRPLIVHGIGWRPGQYEDAGLPFYCVLDATDASTGERQLVSCGGTNVIAQLIRAEQQGWLPMRCRLTQARQPTAQGYFPLWLRPWDESQTKAAAEGSPMF